MEVACAVSGEPRGLSLQRFTLKCNLTTIQYDTNDLIMEVLVSSYVYRPHFPSHLPPALYLRGNKFKTLPVATFSSVKDEKAPA